MRLGMKALLGFLAAALVQPGVVAQSGDKEQRDSGRYGLAADCTHDDTWLNCKVSVRDLVYDNILFTDWKVSAKLDGALSNTIGFEGHPAQGKPQQVAVTVGMVEGSQNSPLAKVAVQVHEGENLIQDHALTFPAPSAAH